MGRSGQVEEQAAGLGDYRYFASDVSIRGDGNIRRTCGQGRADSEYPMSLEVERKELNQLCRELLLLDGDIHKLETKLEKIKTRRDTLYLEIDRKLDE